MKPNQLFLCAVGRSGTTILRTSLGLHPDIYYNNRENNVVQDLISVAQLNCTSDSRRFAMVVTQPEYDVVFRTAISDLIWPDHELRQRTTRMAAINPNGDQLDYLRQVFPAAKILCLVRNGIEVISSRMRYPSFAKADFATHCEVWNRSQSVFEWGQANADAFQLIRHDWFYDPQLLSDSLNKLFDGLGISASELPATNILDRLQHPTDSQQVDFGAMTAQEKSAYFQSKSDRWKDWTDEQRDTFKTKCGTFMQQLGYVIPW